MFSLLDGKRMDIFTHIADNRPGICTGTQQMSADEHTNVEDKREVC